MIVPIFHEVISISKARKKLSLPGLEDEHDEMMARLKPLLTGQVGGEPDIDSLEYLLRNFRNAGKVGAFLPALLREGQAYPAPYGDAIYYGFGNIPSVRSPRAGDIKDSVVFEGTLHHDSRRIVLNRAMMGEACEFVAIFSMSCCAQGDLCVASSIKMNGRRINNWKLSEGAREKGFGAMLVNSEGRMNAGEIKEGHEGAVIHQLYHAGGYAHHCGSMPSPGIPG